MTIALGLSLLVTSAHANPALVRYFDLGRPACTSHLADARARVPKHRLHSARLTYRAARPGDEIALGQALDDPDVARWFFSDPTTDARDIARYVRKLLDVVRVGRSPELGWTRALRLVVVERGHRRPIGAVMIQRASVPGRWEIGYALAAPARGRGFGREVVGHLCNVVRGLDPHGEIEAHPWSDNSVSRHLLSEAGFELVEPPPALFGQARPLVYRLKPAQGR